MIIGIIIAIAATIWHHQSSVYPNWTTGMIVLFSIGFGIAFIGLIVFGIGFIAWGLYSPLESEIVIKEPKYPTGPEEPEISLEARRITKTRKKPLPPLPVKKSPGYIEESSVSEEILPSVEKPPLPPFSKEVFSQVIYDPVSKTNITVGELRSKCNKFSLTNLSKAQLIPVYQEYCFDILKDKFERSYYRPTLI